MYGYYVGPSPTAAEQLGVQMLHLREVAFASFSSKLLIIRIDQDIEFTSKLINREDLSDGEGRFI